MLRIEQVEKALIAIEIQLSKSDCDFDKVKGELMSLRRWDNELMRCMAGISNKITELEKQADKSIKLLAMDNH